jgi:hypothetical protein
MSKPTDPATSPSSTESTEVLEFPTDFAEAVARIQALAEQQAVKKKSDTKGKVFRSIHDLYLARAR